MKRIVTIQDISAVGKCSLTVALPILSAMGVECAVLPTAVLSTHTAFSGFTFHDLTCEIAPISAHWKKENIGIDAIYTGYLGSFEQIDLVSSFFDDFKGADTGIVIDPVMADDGVLYKGFTTDFVKRMAALCAKADLILPNLTEASFLLDIPYKETYSEESIKDMLVALTGLGAKTAAMTGVSFEEGKIGVMAYHAATKKFFSYFNERLPARFHGTGDIYASAAVGALTRGFSTEEALAVAVDYTLECIRLTLADPGHRWYGVNFEEAIPFLLKRIGLMG